MPATLLEKISVINSAIRTLLATVLLGGVAGGTYLGYQKFNAKENEARQAARELQLAQANLSQAQAQLVVKDEEIGELNSQVAEQQQEIARLDTAMRLLKVDQRVATLSVLAQERDENGKVLSSTIVFQEVNGHGDPLGDPRQFKIAGDLVYVDSWVVKFEDKYVEQADLLRGTSLVLFRRIFGEQQKPQDGFVLDAEGARPAVYGAGSEMSEFESKIWSDFWNVADDAVRQADLGIRAMHAEAPSKRVKAGRRYRITRRASAGLTFDDDGELPPPPEPAA